MSIDYVFIGSSMPREQHLWNLSITVDSPWSPSANFTTIGRCQDENESAAHVAVLALLLISVGLTKVGTRRIPAKVNNFVSWI